MVHWYGPLPSLRSGPAAGSRPRPPLTLSPLMPVSYLPYGNGSLPAVRRDREMTNAPHSDWAFCHYCCWGLLYRIGI